MRVALVQMSSTKDVEENLNACRAAAARAASDGAKWILYPENAPFLGRDVEKLEVAEPIDGRITDVYRDIATKHELWVTVGSIPELSDEEHRTYNTQLLVSPEGDLAAVYRKIHLFDVDVEGGRSFRESDDVKPGDEVVTADMTVDGESFVCGLTVCYDLRFPELYRALTQRGAEVITAPSAFTLQTGRDHWHPLLQARAIENQCWVLAPDQWGHHFGKRQSYGHTAAYDPWGRLVTCASDCTTTVYADVDIDYLRQVRQRMPCLQHRTM